MASTIPPIEVRALYDGAELQRGMSDAETDVKDLAREFDYAADDMNASLKSVDDGVSSSLGSGGTLDQGTDVGVDSMKDMASTAREEVPAAMLDMRDGVTGAAEGIAQAMASLGPGGTVVASVIAGFVVMKGRAEAAAQAMRDQVNEAFTAIEVKARTTNKAIERMYEKQLEFTKTLEKFGDGDATKGYEKLAHYAEVLGVETADVVAFIQGKQTPAAERVAQLIERQSDSLKAQGRELADNYGTMTDTQTVAFALAKAAEDEQKVRDQTTDMLRANRDYLRESRDATQEAETSTRQTAEDAERIAEAAERTAAALLNAARSASTVGRNLSGDN